MQTHLFTTELSHFETLGNGVRLAFIEANTANKKPIKPCISITLSVGHFHAGEFPEGFAHLYEHMLFNASTKYKNADALDQCLFTHHGQVNGWTQDLSTHVHMSCDASGFEQACDILLDRLTAPLLQHHEIEKEIIAINGEFHGQKHDPVRQLLSVQKASCNPAHPFRLFSSGNHDTLSNVPVSQMHTLLQQYHHSAMQGRHLSICIGLGNQTNQALANESENQLCNDKIIKVLTEKISASFIAQPTRTAGESVCNITWPPMYLPQHLHKFIQIKHQHPSHQLIVRYIIDKSKDETLRKMFDGNYLMLCHLVESKHNGGLFHALHSAKLIYNIHSNYKSIDHHQLEWVVSIQLSDAGSQAPLLVYQYVQSFLQYLENEGIESWRFREHKTQHALSLKVARGSSLLEDCIELSDYISRLPANNAVLTTLPKSHAASHKHEKPWQLLPTIMSQLKAPFAQVFFISSLAQSQYVTSHYHSLYSINDLGEGLKSAPNRSFAKPQQNPYMASHYPLVKKQLDAQQMLQLTSMHTHFKFYQGPSFNKPNGECYISISDPQMYSTPLHIAAKRVWLSCLNEHLAAVFFDVELASIHFRVYAHHHGISIHTGGLSERQLFLCMKLVNEIRQYKASKETIAQHIKKVASTMNKKPNHRPINQLFAHLNDFYQAPEKQQGRLLESLNNLHVNQIFIQQGKYFAYNFVESLLIGNWQIGSAKRFFAQLNSRFTACQGFTKPNLDCPSIAPSQHIHEHTSGAQESSFIWHYLPLLNDREKNDLRTSKTLKLCLSARALVLEKLLSHTIFDVLRQQHKMGYELGVGYKPISRYPGIVMYAVSPSHSIEDIHEAMVQAIANAKRLIVEDIVSLAALVPDLCKQVTPKDADISQTASRTWLHFDDANPINGYEELVVALLALTKDEIVRVLDNLATKRLGQIILSTSPNVLTPIISASACSLSA